MRQPHAAAGPDRLPWLDDEPEPRARRAGSVLWPGVAAGMLAVAAASYWIGANYRQEPPAPAPLPVVTPAPEPRPTQDEVKLDRVPEIAPIAAPTVRPVPQREVPLRRIERPDPAPVAVPQPQILAPPAQQPLTLWPATRSAGASGRLVRIGAFGSRLQAKRGWAAMVRAYPAMRRLPAVVAESRNSKGRGFYRFQIGTTSQAHSEVLCQRMQAIRFSCAVVGLPWKPRGVER